jgi:hypothetical protein
MAIQRTTPRTAIGMIISPQSGAYEEAIKLTGFGISNILHEYTVLANAGPKCVL